MRRNAGLLLAAAAVTVWLACVRKPPPVSGSLSVSVPHDVDTLDPHRHNRLSSFSVASHLYEPLVTTDPHLTIVPCLADRWDNPDLLTWVFHLRPGVTFHDGSPLTAEDVVATFDRLLGGSELGISGYLTSLASVKARSPQTVEIRTREPLAILLNKLRFVLITRKGADALALERTANGTGPYRLVSFRPNEEVSLERYDGYRGPAPAMKSVVLRLARGPEQALQDLVDGRSQLVSCSSKRLVEAAGRLDGIRVERQSSIFVKLLSWDLARESTPFARAGREPRSGALVDRSQRNPFRDRRVREAIHLAIDRRALISRLSTFAVPASQPVPPFIFGFDPRLTEPVADPSRARALLAEAGYPDGFSTTLHVRTPFGEAADLVRDFLAPLGIRVEVAKLPEGEFFREAQSERGVSFFLTRFGCPTGDASDILEQALHSIDPGRHLGASNLSGYREAGMDRLIEESAVILEMGRRLPLLQAAMRRAMADLVWAPLYVDQEAYAVREELVWKPRADNFLLAAEVGVR